MARQVVFRNLLLRQGYASLDEVRAEVEIRNLREAVVEVLTARGFAVGEDLRTALASTSDSAVLRSVHRQAVTAPSIAEILDALRD